MAKAAVKELKEKTAKAEVANEEAGNTKAESGEGKTKVRPFNSLPRTQQRVYVLRQGEDSNSGFRFLPGGTPLFSLDCAIRASYKERQQDAKAKSLWYRLEVYGGVAHTLAQWEELGLLQPGAVLLAAGEFEVQHWSRDDDTVGEKLVLRADGVWLEARPPKTENSETADE